MSSHKHLVCIPSLGSTYVATGFGMRNSMVVWEVTRFFWSGGVRGEKDLEQQFFILLSKLSGTHLQTILRFIKTSLSPIGVIYSRLQTGIWTSLPKVVTVRDGNKNLLSVISSYCEQMAPAIFLAKRWIIRCQSEGEHKKMKHCSKVGEICLIQPSPLLYTLQTDLSF